jgi:hypothetical protein
MQITYSQTYCATMTLNMDAHHQIFHQVALATTSDNSLRHDKGITGLLYTLGSPLFSFHLQGTGNRTRREDEVQLGSAVFL